MKTTLTILLLLLATSVVAFDGEREGVFVTAGIGFSPGARWEIDSFSSIGETNTGFGLDLFAGYGLTENIIVGVQKIGVFTKATIVTRSEETIQQGYTGVSLHYYEGDPGSAFIFSTGLGMTDLWVLEGGDGTSHAPDIGYLVGFGYEFSDHFAGYLSFTSGKTTTDTFEFNHYQFLFTLSFLAY